MAAASEALGLSRSAREPAVPREQRPRSLPATALRFLRVVLHFGQGWLQLALLFPLLDPQRRARRVEAWCAQLLRIAGVTLVREGRPAAAGAALLVANHVSWLDMAAIRFLRSARFVAKSEVRQWPLLGGIASRCGTVYVDRNSGRSAAAVTRQIAGVLDAGDAVVLFPEGTTTDGTHVMPFQSALLQGAIEAGARVQPIALRYAEPGNGAICRRAAYAGDDSLAASIWRTVSRPLVLRIVFGDSIDATGYRRRALAAQLHDSVQGMLAEAPAAARCLNPCPAAACRTATTHC
jgi:1-acyl-sn-glycerol-3-phosphate acyltransferase